MHTYEFRRRLVCIALLVAVPLLFLSCWQPELHEMNEENTTKSSVESVVPSSASPSSAMQVFSSDAALALDPVLLEYTTLYLAPVHNLVFNQWNSPQEIGGTALFYTGLQRLYGYYYGKADLCAFYGVEGKNMDVPSNEYGQWMFPADSLEKAALANMNIPPEQMRESDLYDEKTKCYLFPQLGCLGEESVPYVTQA